jgi:DNA polymerase-3 subunit delta'
VRLVGIVGQPRAVTALSSALDSGRFHPSLIFQGPSGTGKLTTALALARAFSCPEPDPPCLRCSGCRRIDAASLRHPDLFVIFPERSEDFKKGDPAVEGVSGLDVQERQATAERNRAWGILIDRVREGIAFVQRRPTEGRRAILILDQADRLGNEAANALLKTMEEPPEHALVILLANAVHALLGTLRSRSRIVTFRPLSTDAVATWLEEERGLPAAEARERALLSRGRIGTALGADLEKYRERREAMLGLLEGILTPPDPGRALARAEEIAKSGESADLDLEILSSLLRDRMLLDGAGGGAPALVHGDVARRLSHLALATGRDGTAAVIALERALDGMRRKGANRQLLLENAFLDLVPEGSR